MLSYVYRLGVIAISLPVSTASCERSFSALRHIKTWVRNLISNEKLDMRGSILAIERERAQSLNTLTPAKLLKRLLQHR